MIGIAGVWPSPDPESITFDVPWVPDTRCRPNAKVSERTRIRYRKQGATAAAYPMRAARMAVAGFGAGPIFRGSVLMDVTIHWPKGRQAWDSDAVVSSTKYLRDMLEKEGIVGNDRQVRVGDIEQKAQGVHQGQPCVIVTIRQGAKT